jgi:hypothetical protein
LRGGVAPRLLLEEQVDDLGTRPLTCLRAGNGITPGLRLRWIAGKESRDCRKVERVVSGELANPGKPTHIDRDALSNGGTRN